MDMHSCHDPEISAGKVQSDMITPNLAVTDFTEKKLQENSLGMLKRTPLLQFLSKHIKNLEVRMKKIRQNQRVIGFHAAGLTRLGARSYFSLSCMQDSTYLMSGNVMIISSNWFAKSYMVSTC